MLHVSEAIVVEGKYDKQKLQSIVDATILVTDGFRIFQNQEQKALLTRIASERGIVILTDSDRAGFAIRNHLKGILPKEQIKHAYVPDMKGKERRKKSPSKEGLLGVEGMDTEVLTRALVRAGCTVNQVEAVSSPITKQDLFHAGLSGKADSAEKRRILCNQLDLPKRLSANALLDVLNALMTREQFLEQAEKVQILS